MPPGLHEAGRKALREVQGRAGPHAAAEAGPPGGAERAAQRHRDEDLRDRQRPGLAALHRAARQPPRRGRDPQAGGRGAEDHAAGSAEHLRRLSAGEAERRHLRGGDGASQGLKRSVADSLA